MVTKRIKFINLLLSLGIALFLIHYIIGFFMAKELIFLVMSLLFILGFLILLLYSLIEFAIEKTPADLWKLGFLGCFGLIGLLPGLTPAFALFAFFGFFGARNYY
jgi:hypothetical protein